MGARPGRRRAAGEGRTAPICGSALGGGPEREVDLGGSGRRPARIGTDRRPPGNDDKCNAYERLFLRWPRRLADEITGGYSALRRIYHYLRGKNDNYPARETAARNRDR